MINHFYPLPTSLGNLMPRSTVNSMRYVRVPHVRRPSLVPLKARSEPVGKPSWSVPFSAIEFLTNHEATTINHYQSLYQSNYLFMKFM